MGALLDAVPAGGADHTEHHRDLATAIEAVPAAYQPLDSDLTAIAALTPSEGDTLTYASGHWTAAAPSGGGGTRLLDLGVVDMETGTFPDTLYSTGAGEYVVALYWGESTLTDTGAFLVSVGGGPSGSPFIYVTDTTITAFDPANCGRATSGDVVADIDTGTPTVGSVHVYALVGTAEAP